MDVLFSYCRYYKGEKTNPFPEGDARALLWEYERTWCEMQTKKDASMHDMMYDYNIHGLSDFEPYDGVPVSLKAFLFNRFSHWIEANADAFKEWYNDTYKKTGR